jgi:WD40 repeat protein
MVWDVSTTGQRDYPSSTFVGNVIADLPWTFVTSLVWTDDDELITTSENEAINYIFHSAERWDTNTGDSRGVILQTEGNCGVYGWNSDFSRIACTDYDYTQVEVRSIETDEILLAIPIEDAVRDSFVWSPDDKILAITTWNGETNTAAVELRDSSMGELLTIYPNARHPIWSPDSNKLLLTISDGDIETLRIFHVTTEDVLATTEIFYTLDWSPDSRLLALATHDDFRLLDVDTGETIESIPILGIIGLAWSPDGTMLALAKSDGTIRIWDVSDLTTHNGS